MQASGFVTVGSYLGSFVQGRSAIHLVCVWFLWVVVVVRFLESRFAFLHFFFVLISLVFALRGLYTFLHYSPRIIFRSTMHFTHVDV